MDIKAISLEGWQQFQKIDIEFHDRLTVITGSNGSGKTTIMNLLARHVDWSQHSLATPKKGKATKAWEWVTGLFLDNQTGKKTIGEIVYSDGPASKLLVPSQTSAQYQVEIENMRSFNGFFIPSHRSIFRYQRITNISTQPIGRRQAFSNVSSSNKNRYMSNGHDVPSSFHMKEALISWNTFGYGNPDMEPDTRLLSYYKEFEKVLSDVLPAELGFKRITIRNFEIVFECDSGDFTIEATSGGISTIIDMAWQIFMYAEDDPKFTVLIDEVENHLHPTMQRRILSDFIAAFPGVKFIVTTHSPLIVGSVKDSNVYVLRRDEGKKVIAQKIDLVNKANSATEILDQVLGVSFSRPVWAEEALNKIVGDFLKMNLEDPSTFQQLRQRLSEEGLSSLVPSAIENLVSNYEKN